VSRLERNVAGPIAQEYQIVLLENDRFGDAFGD
jgi:ribosomal protein S28E/S33